MKETVQLVPTNIQGEIIDGREVEFQLMDRSSFYEASNRIAKKMIPIVNKYKSAMANKFKTERNRT